MSSGDQLFIYIGGHGGFRDPDDPEREWPQLESTLTTTNEFVVFTRVADNYLTDDKLYKYLNNMKNGNDIEKYIFIDACHSGGFWGNHDEDDEGDLEKLSKIALFAAAKEDGKTFFRWDGLPEFGKALEDMLTLKENGFVKGDEDEDGILKISEIQEYLPRHLAQSHDINEIVYEQSFGDAFIWTPELADPVFFSTSDFSGDINYFHKDLEHPLQILIDIKPDSYPNSINLKSKGSVPVAILTIDNFETIDVDPETILFADAEPTHWSIEDVDDDGDMDILFHFKIQELNLIESSTDAVLIGNTYDGIEFEGIDLVNIVPK